MEKVCKDERGPRQGTEILSEEKRCQQSEWEGAVGEVGGTPGEWGVLEWGVFQKSENSLQSS